jgi:hypothetical protein
MVGAAHPVTRIGRETAEHKQCVRPIMTVWNGSNQKYGRARNLRARPQGLEEARLGVHLTSPSAEFFPQNGAQTQKSSSQQP